LQGPPSYGPGIYGQPLGPAAPQPQRSSVAEMFAAGDFTSAAAQRIQSGKMFDFDMRGYLGSVRQHPLPGIIHNDYVQSLKQK